MEHRSVDMYIGSKTPSATDRLLRNLEIMKNGCTDPSSDLLDQGATYKYFRKQGVPEEDDVIGSKKIEKNLADFSSPLYSPQEANLPMTFLDKEKRGDIEPTQSGRVDDHLERVMKTKTQALSSSEKPGPKKQEIPAKKTEVLGAKKSTTPQRTATPTKKAPTTSVTSSSKPKAPVAAPKPASSVLMTTPSSGKKFTPLLQSSGKKN